MPKTYHTKATQEIEQYLSLQKDKRDVYKRQVISLGTRVVLAYTLSGISAIGVIGIWVAIPIGWFLADAAGIIYYIFKAGKSHI